MCTAYEILRLTFSVNKCQTVGFNIEITEHVDSGDIRQIWNLEVLARREGLTTDLGFVLQSEQFRYDARLF